MDVATEQLTYEEVWSLLERQLRSSIKLEWQTTETVILAIDSEKGGVGKSALAAGLVAVMSANGYPTLAIDLDPRATLTAELAAETTGEFTVNDLLYADPEANPDEVPNLRGLAADALRPAGPAWGELVQVIAAERALANRETDPTSNMEQRLRVSLEGVAEQFRLIVIDLPPRAGGKLVGAGLIAATHIVFPGTLDEDGLVGVRDARKTYRLMEPTLHHKLIDVGVLRNIIDRKTKLGTIYDKKYTDEFGKLLAPCAVPRRVVRGEARTGCVPITIATTQDARDVINGYTALLNHIGRAA